MKLFHGTCASVVPRVLRDGIRSRGKRKGNWDKYPSRPDMVYLTAAYACYYGYHAAKKQAVAVFEVDTERLDKGNLYPDEDFIAQALAHQQGKSLEQVHRVVRRTLSKYQHHWRDSLAGLGNVCYRGAIPAEAITRYAILRDNCCREFQMAALDPSISVINYRLLGDKYRSMMAWLFGDAAEWQIGWSGMSNAEYLATCKKWHPSVPEIGDLFSNRTGIEVVTL